MPLGAFKTAMLGAAGSGGAGSAWETIATTDFDGAYTVSYTGIDSTKYSMLRAVYWAPGATSPTGGSGANPYWKGKFNNPGSYSHNYMFEANRNGTRYKSINSQSTEFDWSYSLGSGDSSNVGYGRMNILHCTTGPRDSVTKRQVGTSMGSWYGNGNNPQTDRFWFGNVVYSYGSNSEGVTQLDLTFNNSGWTAPSGAVMTLYGLLQP